MANLYRAVVIKNEQVAQDTFRMTLNVPNIAEIARAGQFIEIKIPSCKNILWRRPFSIHDCDHIKETIDVLYKVIGCGTKVLVETRKNQELDILGPLGNSFKYDKNVELAIIVAGGLGIAPFMLLQKELQNLGIETILLYGVGNSRQFCDLEYWQKKVKILVSTIDGSLGHHGLVTDLLSKQLLFMKKKPHLFVCGPTPMLMKVQEISRRNSIKAQVSVETIMACGFGACVGCVVPKSTQTGGNKYFLACKDGPVFDMNKIIIQDD